ncbi:MAG: hypothetical protein ACR2PM_18845, partial [Hyphomicrobiales bacterium]
EKAAFAGIRFLFPRPKPKDYVLNFYAFAKDGRAVVVMPLLSLKMLEDLTTAYAWLHRNGYSLGTIDLYFAMLHHRARKDFPGGRYPPPLEALGVPETALKDPKVDENSLAFRNEAFAFILLHELGHVLYKHKGYDEITKAQARADETRSDRFALDVLGRTGTPPLGAVMFFQAQFYSLPHRGLFASAEAWQNYMHKAATHPLTGDRIEALARYVSGDLADSRPKERDIWLFIGKGLNDIVGNLNDMDLQKCMTLVAKNAPMDILRPRKDIAHAQMERICAELK